ncbi:extensin-like [Rhododendron vialii]|uniref:extensin-like n=1 Tax=Rhododendron vialii TaxID=182163 RepID=UPI00265E1D92|nr:extensin-like [Rhododendron vialii]
MPTPPHSRSLVLAASINGLSGSSLRQFPLTRFSSPSSSSSNYFISTPHPVPDRELRGIEPIPTTVTPTPETPHRRNPLLSPSPSPSPMETKTPNFHPPPLLMAAMHPLSAPPAGRPALRVRSPRPRTGRVRHSCLDRWFSFDVNIVLQWNFRNLEGIWMGRKRGRERRRRRRRRRSQYF